MRINRAKAGRKSLAAGTDIKYNGFGMRKEPLNRDRLTFYPLVERESRVGVDGDLIMPGGAPGRLSGDAAETARICASRIRSARAGGKPVIMAFGAHVIKNGLGPLLIHMMERDWLTHLATNGAGVIHDWELAWLGRTSEYVEANLHAGRFGTWEETGFYINLALLAGAYGGLGYGESVGAMIGNERIDVPSATELRKRLRSCCGTIPIPPDAGAAADLLEAIEGGAAPEGGLDIPHPYARYSPQAAAYRLGVPFTAHPMIGHDIIYTHPLNHGGAVGRTALRDFLLFARSVSELEGGVYLSVGSAVMSPMIFEKSMSMAQNLALQAGERIENHSITVVDLQESTWDWSGGEPPQEHPDYYLRFYKTFRRMGGQLRYACADNRSFLLQLCRELEG